MSIELSAPDQFQRPRSLLSRTSQDFKYPPLLGERSLRVLELFPGNPDDEICSRLHETDLESARHSYEALSYVWGDVRQQTEIRCNGNTTRVTVNLASGLRMLRDPVGSRNIWVDAICINQNDDAEKGRQIRLMADIFKCAREVVVWLGHDAKDTAKYCFSLIQQTNCYLGHLWKEYRGNLEAIPLISLPAPISGPAIGESVSLLLSLPWFERLWVVQEVAVARECVLVWGVHQMRIAQLAELVVWMTFRAELRTLCGLDVLTYAAVVIFGYCTYEHEGTWRASPPLLESLVERYIAPHEWSLSHVLHAGRYLRATYSIDYVYAFLGNPLAHVGKNVDDDGQGALIVEPDYTKEATDVFHDIACALLKSRRDAPYLLSFVVHSSEEDIGGREFPSWVPRWNNHLRHLGASPSYWYRAGGESSNFQARIQESKLLLRAQVFDLLSWTSEIIKWENIALDYRGWDDEWRSSASGETYLGHLWEAVRQNFGSIIGPTTAADSQPNELEDCFFLTLARGFCEEKTGSLTESRLVECRQLYHAFRHVLQHQAKPLRDQISNPSDKLRRQAHRFFQEISFGDNQKLAITHSGRLCLVPRFSRPGDVCCILLGSSMPVILRPTTQDDAFNLVGAAYIHGIMGGELAGASGEDGDDLKWKEIAIT